MCIKKILNNQKPDGITYVIMSSIGGERMKMCKKNICLLKLLNSVVKLFNYSCSEYAWELFVLLTDYVIQNLIRTLQIDLNSAFVVFWGVVCRPL